MAHVTLMSGPERRRRWSAAEQREILMAAFSRGAVVADIARRYEVATSLIYKWRREVLAARDEGGFVPAFVVDGATHAEPAADRAGRSCARPASRATVRRVSPRKDDVRLRAREGAVIY